MLRFKTVYGSWTASDGVTYVDEVEVEEPSEALVRDAGSAHAAGVIEVSEGLDVSHVEDDEDSKTKLAEAQGNWVPPAIQEDGTFKSGYWDGPWAEGHYAQVDADLEARALNDEIVIDVDSVGSADAVLGEDK